MWLPGHPVPHQALSFWPAGITCGVSRWGLCIASHNRELLGYETCQFYTHTAVEVAWSSQESCLITLQHLGLLTIVILNQGHPTGNIAHIRSLLFHIITHQGAQFSACSQGNRPPPLFTGIRGDMDHRWATCNSFLPTRPLLRGKGKCLLVMMPPQQV